MSVYTHANCSFHHAAIVGSLYLTKSDKHSSDLPSEPSPFPELISTSINHQQARTWTLMCFLQNGCQRFQIGQSGSDHPWDSMLPNVFDWTHIFIYFCFKRKTMLIKCGNGTCTFFISTFNCRLYIDSVQASSAAGFAWFSRICNRYTSFRAALDSEELVCNRDVVRSLHEGYPKCLNVINHKKYHSGRVFL